MEAECNVDGISCLQEAIRSVPIPGAPPRLSQDGAAVGLAFLDVALRQNHIRRLTERLTLIEHRAARCTTEVDLSVALLDESQREAGLLYQRLRNRSDPKVRLADERPGDVAPIDTGLIWVPVSRVSRRSHSPIDVISDGHKLPRLTQYETSRLMASALYRLLRAILGTHPDARERGDLSDFLFRVDESRWLVQAALVALLTERSRPDTPWDSPVATVGTVKGHGARYRSFALDVLAKYDKTLREYVTLLDVAVNDYLLVVGLDSAQDEHLLAFDTPLHVKDAPKDRWFRRPFRLAGGAYWIDYSTELPAGLRAYHLVAETEPGLQIETMHLASDADDSIVGALSADLRTLAARVEAERTSPTQDSGLKLLEMELQAALRQLSELLRRRRWEASQAGLNLSQSRLPAAMRLAWAASSGEATMTEQGTPRNSLFHHPLVTAANLAAAADEIEREDVRLDLNLENDPANERAHVYWRRDPSRVLSGRTIRISSSLFIRDSSGSRPSSIIAYVAAVIAISYVLGCLLFASAFPYTARGGLTNAGNADAIIAVLLLVPGFLYTRLDLPVRHSIAGQLKVLPRFVGYVTILCTAVLAATIAANASPALVRGALALCAVVPAVALLLMVGMSRAVRTKPFRVAPRLPRWTQTARAPQTGLLSRLAGALRRLLLRALNAAPDAVFHTSGARS
jgi:hypothetical protein